MTVSKNPISFQGWFGYRHIPYPKDSGSFQLARQIVQTRLTKKEFFEITALHAAARAYIDPHRPIVDGCCGHGLLGLLMACDPRPPTIFCVDRSFPPNCARMATLFAPLISDADRRIQLEEADVASLEHLHPGTLTAAHACGDATELLLNSALDQRARFILMPCCVTRKIAQHYGFETPFRNLEAINHGRLAAAQARGYRVRLLEIDPRITPFNQILVGWPAEEPHSPSGGLGEGPLPFELPPKLRRLDAAVGG